MGGLIHCVSGFTACFSPRSHTTLAASRCDSPARNED
jgi:hypothetical protein